MMGQYDQIDITNEADQQLVFRKIGKLMADITLTKPSDLAHDMGMPDNIVDWLDEVGAYFVICVTRD